MGRKSKFRLRNVYIKNNNISVNIVATTAESINESFIKDKEIIEHLIKTIKGNEKDERVNRSVPPPLTLFSNINDRKEDNELLEEQNKKKECKSTIDNCSLFDLFDDDDVEDDDFHNCDFGDDSYGNNDNEFSQFLW